MTRVLVIDDEPINHQLVARVLEPLHYELQFSANGKDGVAKARSLKPDLIITDVMMPDLDGYEVTRILRREPQFAATPILVLTAQAGLQDKLKSFEAGADDHLTKPFEAAELLMRVTSLLRRMEAARLPQPEAQTNQSARMIAIHSLRGGTGASSLAVNLGVGLASLWKKPTALLDLTMTAGQVAMMLNMPLKRTWTDIARFNADELDMDAVMSIVGTHESGLSFIAAPTFPSEAETLHSETLGAALRLAKGQFEYIVSDLPHNFSEPAIQALDVADIILMVATPDMSSIRAAVAAIDTYGKLGYKREKIKLVLNAIFPRSGLSKEKIESALGMLAVVMIPYVQDVFVNAINLGQPPVYYNPHESVSALLEDFALLVSKDDHKKSKPENPTEAWKRVYRRYQERKKR
ncbi:MAG TPA: response regulator [Anaerolineales bacterium]|nr:response regulator [Anaerolineales bacterium]